MCSFHSKTGFTFLLYLITFESIELKQSVIPHLKVLVCGINAFSSQWCGCIFILCYTHLNLALLLHKQGLVATGVGTTVVCFMRALSHANLHFAYKKVLVKLSKLRLTDFWRFTVVPIGKFTSTVL